MTQEAAWNVAPMQAGYEPAQQCRAAFTAGLRDHQVTQHQDREHGDGIDQIPDRLHGIKPMHNNILVPRKQRVEMRFSHRAVSGGLTAPLTGALQTPCQAEGGSVCVLCSAVLGRLARSVNAFVLLPSPPHPTYDKNC